MRRATRTRGLAIGGFQFYLILFRTFCRLLNFNISRRRDMLAKQQTRRRAHLRGNAAYAPLVAGSRPHRHRAAGDAGDGGPRRADLDGGHPGARVGPKDSHTEKITEQIDALEVKAHADDALPSPVEQELGPKRSAKARKRLPNPQSTHLPGLWQTWVYQQRYVQTSTLQRAA